MRSEELLEQIAARLNDARGNYRDAILEVGRLSHQFVLLRVVETVHVPEERRRARGAHREGAIRELAARLGKDPGWVRVIIAGAMTVELLGEGLDLGQLSLYAIRQFARCVERPAVAGAGNRRQRRAERLADPEGQERWAVKPACQEWARELFARAVRECWSPATAESELMARVPAGNKPRTKVRAVSPGAQAAAGVADPGKRPARSRPRPRTPPTELKTQEEAIRMLMPAVAGGSPRDVAEMLFTLVRESADPVAVAEHLRGMVRYMKPKPQLAGCC